MQSFTVVFVYDAWLLESKCFLFSLFVPFLVHFILFMNLPTFRLLY